MQLAAVLLSLAVLLPSVPAAFASQSAAEGTAVVFSESGITAADESGLSIDGTTLTIEQAGTYVLSGTCSDGSVKVKKGVTGVTLVLSGLDLTSSTTAPITCGKSSGVTILAAEGTENALTDAAANNGDNYPDNADAENAVIKCKDGSQVTIGGTGTLTVTANGKNGIKSGATTDEEGTAWLVIEDLTLTINAPVNDAVNAEASLTVKSGTITIDAGDDALHADYALAIGESGTAGPTITINSCYEGLAGANLLVASGAITIYSEDDCLNAANSDLTGYDFTMGITGGTIRAYAASDDGLDSNGSLTISGGTLTVWTANTADNQALDADGTITVSGGTVFAAGGSAGMGMTLSASQPYVTFGTQASQPGQGGRQQNGGNAPGGQQDGSTPPSMPDGQSGSQNLFLHDPAFLSLICNSKRQLLVRLGANPSKSRRAFPKRISSVGHTISLDGASGDDDLGIGTCGAVRVISNLEALKDNQINSSSTFCNSVLRLVIVARMICNGHPPLSRNLVSNLIGGALNAGNAVLDLHEHEASFAAGLNMHGRILIIGVSGHQLIAVASTAVTSGSFAIGINRGLVQGDSQLTNGKSVGNRTGAGSQPGQCATDADGHGQRQGKYQGQCLFHVFSSPFFSWGRLFWVPGKFIKCLSAFPLYQAGRRAFAPPPSGRTFPPI